MQTNILALLLLAVLAVLESYKRIGWELKHLLGNSLTVFVVSAFLGALIAIVVNTL